MTGYETKRGEKVGKVGKREKERKREREREKERERESSFRMMGYEMNGPPRWRGDMK